MQYLGFIDGLRAIAVVSVVLYHANQSLIANGYLGVDIFFVISGFIVSYSVAQRKYHGFFQFVTDFYARRFVRIFPALFACLVVTSIATFLFIPDAFLSNSIDGTRNYAFIGLSNVFLARGTDYFSAVTEYNPFTHTWSLGVEEQFYFLFPLLFSTWALSLGKKYISVAIYSAALVASFVVWLWLEDSAPLQAFYMIYARFWELAVGVVCFQLTDIFNKRERDDRLSTSLLRAGTVLTALSVLVTALFWRLPPSDQWVANVAVVLGTALVIGALRYRNSYNFGPEMLLQLRPIRFIGRISYSLYLWHWPVFVLARWTFGITTPMQITIALALVIALSLSSYYFVETPFRRSAAVRTLPRLAVVTSGVLVAVTGCLTFQALAAGKAMFSLSTVMQNRELWVPDIEPDRYSDIPDCTITSTSIGHALSYTRAGCDPSSQTARLFVLGDSHTGAYTPMIKRFTLKTGIQSIVVPTAGCAFISLQQDRDGTPACVAATKEGFRILRDETRPGDIVFLPSLRVPRLAEQYFQFSDESALDQVFGPGRAEQRSAAIEQAIDGLRPLTEKGVTILFEGPTPLFRSPAFRCSDWFNRNNPSCKYGLSVEREFLVKLRQPTLEGFAQIAAHIPNIYVWDPFPILCPDDECSASRAGKPLFFDGDHVSGFANALLTPYFVTEVQRHLPIQALSATTSKP
ncbi:acyltransferase family protein [Mesorhizobium sp. A556]